MTQLKAVTGKASAASDENRWGGVFSENGIFILLEVKGISSDPAPSRGRAILDRLLEKFTMYKKRNLDVVNNLLDEFRNEPAIATLTFGLLDKDVLYLGNIGRGFVYICRGKVKGKLLKSGETASGEVQEGDMLLFSSETTNNIIEEEKLYQVVEAINPEKAVEEIAPIFTDTKESFGAVSLILKFEKDSDEKHTEDQAEDLFYAKEEERREEKEKKGTREIIENIRRKVLNFAPVWLSQIRVKGRHIHREQNRTRKTLKTIAVFFLILLVVSIVFNIGFGKADQARKELDQKLDLVKHQYEEAVSLAQLNPVRTRTLLADSKLTLSPELSKFPKDSSEYKEILAWLEKISEAEVEAYNIYKFTSAPLFFDLTLINEGAEGGKIFLYRDIAALLDAKNQAVYTLTVSSKNTQVVAGKQMVGNSHLIASTDRSIVLKNDRGIISVDIDSKEEKLAVENDQEWGDITGLALFAGNIYLLDREKNSIWKYIGGESGFSPKNNYLSKDVQVDFSQNNQLVIDGSVWVVSGNNLFKFEKGTGQPFSFQGISDTITEPIFLYTSDVSKYIYVLEKNASRILVFDKDGNYQSQYQWDGLKDADDFAVSEEEGKILILSKSKIYSIDLK